MSLHLCRKVLSYLLAFVVVFETPMTFAAAPGNPVPGVRAQLNRIKGSKAAFCFAVENGAITGVNENELIRAASVTKTLTTFWAVEKLGEKFPNFQYETRIHYRPDTRELHIEGMRDPFFDRDRLFTLMADLNAKGITQISRLTFDSNFWFWADASDFRYLRSMGGGGSGGGRAHRGGQHGASKRAAHGRRRRASLDSAPSRLPASVRRAPAMIKDPVERFYMSEDHTKATIAGNPSRIGPSLNALMNTASWSSEIRRFYQLSRASNPRAQLPASLNLSVQSMGVVAREANPLAGKPGVYVYSIRSAPLKMYLKQMNIHSINSWAEELFFSLGGRGVFLGFMEKHFGLGDEVKDVYAGSGVNLSNEDHRYDSLVTCSTVVTVIRKLDQDLERLGLDLSDVLMAPGHGEGSTWEDGSNSLVVKTGTMKYPTRAKNLAGVQESTAGEVYFGIFIDRRGGESGNVGRALTEFRRSFHPVPATVRPYKFDPIAGYSHLRMIYPTIQPPR